MIKMTAIGLAGVAIVAALALGPKAAYNHLRATRDVVRGELQGLSPDVQEAARIRVLIRDQDKSIIEYHEKVADVADQAESATSGLSRIIKELDEEGKILARAKMLLDEGRDRYEIGGKMYSRDELCTDANARLKKSEQLVKQLEFQRDVVAQLRAAERDGRANIVKAEQARREVVSTLETLEMRLANAGLLRQLNELTRGLDKNPLGPESDLQKALGELQKRTRKAERQNAYLAVEDRRGMVVDWDGTANAGPDPSDAIGRFLSRVQ